ncbi:hypothetical protein I551_4783 [Mycobacterium ulcerans str. Harvey]|uniref:Uncharacterized protein n=1 Tax=Mycobacterium ulcerans str. Harvey TaxID=1299332 RepID=A0ABN0QVY7_MYCUL|nr:hypothetical protein I551_4783 [Mycobacterium ulcerans str. Harvey]
MLLTPPLTTHFSRTTQYARHTNREKATKSSQPQRIVIRLRLAPFGQLVQKW